MSEIFKNLALVGDAWVLYLLVLASILSIAVMFERWKAYKPNSGDFSAFLDGVSSCLEKHDLKGAAGLAGASPRVEARVILAG